jgi:hypothetical protein
MRALALTRFAVFVTRRAGEVELVAARSSGAGFQAVGRRSLGAAEAEGFLAELARAGVEIVEVGVAAAAPIALPAPVVAAAAPVAPVSLPRPVESDWLSFSEIVLKTQKIRGPNLR